jgi:hypothetical protein
MKKDEQQNSDQLPISSAQELRSEAMPAPANQQGLLRRTLLKGLAALGGGLALTARHTMTSEGSSTLSPTHRYGPLQVSLGSQIRGEIMSTDTGPIVANQTKGLTPSVVVPGLGRVVNTFAIVGPSATNEQTLTITGFQLSTANPATVLLQPRQSTNRDLGYHDVFAIQVVETAVDHIKIHIKRLDSAEGWGQNLRVDILIIEQTNN